MKRALASFVVATTLALPHVVHAYGEVARRPTTISPPQAMQRVRTALTRVEVDVSLCALEHPEETARAATRGGASLDVRVSVLPSGAWQVVLGDERSGEESAPLVACIQSALTTELGSSFSFARPPAHATEERHRFALSRPASPSQATRIERALARRRASFEACLDGVESAVQVHYETMPHGFVRIVNVDGLPEARFSAGIACLQQAASEVRGIPRHVVFRGTLSLERTTQ